ncbi:hypothetical protein BJ741DRAFT_579344 [Chytriomyces cf. hyalinus JEL632]|nr:hypothetical protein BJ741DRAFT_579344 [Chytriomyces cf. hyalinus JEL632]
MDEAETLRQQLAATLREMNEYRSLLMLPPVSSIDGDGASETVALWGIPRNEMNKGRDKGDFGERRDGLDNGRTSGVDASLSLHANGHNEHLSGSGASHTPDQQQQHQCMFMTPSLQSLPVEMLSLIASFLRPVDILTVTHLCAFFRRHFSHVTEAVFGVSRAFDMPLHLVWPVFHFPCMASETDDDFSDVQDGDHPDPHGASPPGIYNSLVHDPLSNLHQDIPVHLLYAVHSLRKCLNKHGGSAYIKPSSLRWLHQTARLLPNTLDVNIVVAAFDEFHLFESDDSNRIIKMLAKLRKRFNFHIRSLELQCYDVDEDLIADALSGLQIEQLILPDYIPTEIANALPQISGLKAVRIVAVDAEGEDVDNETPFRNIILNCPGLCQLDFWEAQPAFLQNSVLPQIFDFIKTCGYREAATIKSESTSSPAISETLMLHSHSIQSSHPATPSMSARTSPQYDHTTNLTSTPPLPAIREIKFTCAAGTLPLKTQHVICSYKEALEAHGWTVVELQDEGSLMWMYGLVSITEHSERNSISAASNNTNNVQTGCRSSDSGGMTELCLEESFFSHMNPVVAVNDLVAQAKLDAATDERKDSGCDFSGGGPSSSSLPEQVVLDAVVDGLACASDFSELNESHGFTSQQYSWCGGNWDAVTHNFGGGDVSNQTWQDLESGGSESRKNLKRRGGVDGYAAAAAMNFVDDAASQLTRSDGKRSCI